MSFLFLCTMGILFPFVIPLLLGWFSLAVNKDKIKTKIWLTIYGCALLVYVVIVINFGFVNMIKDLPLVIREDYSQINGAVQTIENNQETRIFEIEGITFSIKNDSLENDIKPNENYTIIYLPNSKQVIDIIDGDGESQIRK